MRRRKPKRTKLPRTRYVVRKVDAIAYADTIARLLAEHFGGDTGTRPTTFIGVAWWVAFAVTDGQEEAVGAASMCHSAIEEGSFYLGRCCVAPEHRGHGLQKKLILARVARARELAAQARIKGAFATSDTYDNPPSTNNLISCGFRAYRPVSPWRQEGAMYWRLAL